MKYRDLILIKWVKYGTFTGQYSERDCSWSQFITLKLIVRVFVFTGFLISDLSPHWLAGCGESFSCPSNKVAHLLFCHLALPTQNFLSSLGAVLVLFFAIASFRLLAVAYWSVTCKSADSCYSVAACRDLVWIKLEAEGLQLSHRRSGGSEAEV